MVFTNYYIMMGEGQFSIFYYDFERSSSVPDSLYPGSNPLLPCRTMGKFILRCSNSLSCVYQYLSIRYLQYTDHKIRAKYVYVESLWT